jgi:transcriptional regulator with XRE-family HTH domain
MAKREPPIRHAQIVGLFAERLKELRRSRGMTQQELGRAAKITTSYVGRLEAGGAAPGIDLVARLATALGVTVYDLLPTEASPDIEADLRGRAKTLFDGLIAAADRETLLMLCPLLARLAESPTRRR